VPAECRESAKGIRSDRAQLNMRPLLILSGAMFLSLLARTVFSPLLLVIEGDLGISHKAATQFFLFISVGYSAGMLLSGYLSALLTHRYTIVTAFLTAGISLCCTAFTTSLNAIRLLLLLLGGGAGLYTPSGLAMIMISNDESNLGKAFSIHEIGPNLSLILAPIYAQLFLSNSSWRMGLLILGALCIVHAAVVLIALRDFRGSGEGFTPVNLRNILLSSRFWIMMLFFCLAIGATLGVYSVLPTYLVVERGMGLRLVNSLVGISRVSGIAILFLVGILVDRVGVKWLLAASIALTGLTTAFLSLPAKSVLLVALFLQPIFIESFFPVALTETANLWPRSSYNVAISLMLPSSLLIGGGVVPSLLGVLGERGSFALGFFVMGAVITVCSVFTFMLHRNGSGRI
jgi:NNP family nitrate/nitrite transporter-like MFS transporter